MKNFEVSADSACDLFYDEINALNVYIGQMNLILDRNGQMSEFFDDFKTEQEYIDFYEQLRKGNVAKTAALNVEAHIALFTKMAEAGVKNALHFALSYGLSPEIDNAKIAYEIVKEKYPDINYKMIESKTATVGEGMLVKVACKMRDEGKTLDETVEAIEKMKNQIQHFIIVDDLMYLKRGGRISGSKAVIGTLLNLKPVIEFSKEGKLEIMRKEHGMKKAIRSVVEEAKNYTKNTVDFRSVIVHTDNLAGAKELKYLIMNSLGFEPEIRIMGPTIGAHVGPNAVALAFISNEERPV